MKNGIQLFKLKYYLFLLAKVRFHDLHSRLLAHEHCSPAGYLSMPLVPRARWAQKFERLGFGTRNRLKFSAIKGPSRLRYYIVSPSSNLNWSVGSTTKQFLYRNELEDGVLPKQIVGQRLDFLVDFTEYSVDS